MNLDSMVENNYSEIVNNIEKVLKLYEKRTLSLIGKITVIKAMAIPKLVYVMSVLPKPNPAMIKRLETMFRRFIWGTGKPRLSLRDLEKDISGGGLKLPNIDNLNNALKLCWIKRVIDKTGAWQSNFETLVGAEKSKVWDLDLSSLMHLSSSMTNPFWKEVLCAWHKYKSCFIHHIDVRTYPIWNTVFMVNQNLISLRPEFQSKGVNYINDLLDESGNLMGYLSFKKKFNIDLNFVDFYSLTHAIPRSWKNALFENSIKLNANLVYQKVLTDLLAMEKVCRGTYWTLINMNTSERKINEKWGLCLNKTIEASSFNAYYSIPFTCTIEAKLRSFQYKILQRILPTKKFLKLCNITNDDLCSYCHKEVETIEHLFWRCHCVKIFWNQIASSLLPYIDLSFALNESCILLGTICESNKHLINHVILLCKRYIYINKFVSDKLSISAVLNIIRNVYEIEKNIVIRKALNSQKLDHKWDPIKILFNVNSFV